MYNVPVNYWPLARAQLAISHGTRLRSYTELQLARSPQLWVNALADARVG